eukprot:m.84544 g.84544  ORF g.84544 m.84544 type:complete len:559 (-) comp15026_c0_seq7:359-2035(-)
MRLLLFVAALLLPQLLSAIVAAAPVEDPAGSHVHLGYPPSPMTAREALLLLSEGHQQPATAAYGPLEPSRTHVTPLHFQVLSWWRCTPHHSANVSCHIRNLYLHNGEHYVALLNSDVYPLGSYFLRLSHMADPQPPKELRFKTVEEAAAFFEGKTDTSFNLTLYYGVPWGIMSNWGHCVFDGMYGAYLGMLEFGLEHETVDQIVWKNGEKPMGIYEKFIMRFGGGQLLEWKDMAALYNSNNTGANGGSAKQYLRLNKAIMGSGRKFQRTLQRDVALAGRSMDGLWRFTRRAIHRLNGTTPRDHMLRLPHLNDDFVVQIMNNGRWTEAERKGLQAMAANITARKNSTHPITVRYMDWGEMKNHEDQYKVQLQMQAETDVCITGPGTSLMSPPFMRPGSFVIGVGHCHSFEDRSVATKIPWYMETYMCEAANSYQKCLYLKSRTRCNGMNLTELEELIYQAYNDREYDLPLPAGANLTPEALVFKELCEAMGAAACDKLLDEFNLPGSRWLEMIVYEVLEYHPDNKNTAHGLLNRTLLRQIRKKYEHLLMEIPEAKRGPV